MSQPESRSSATPSGALAVVFLTYDGLLEPLGRSQVLPYVLRLASRGVLMGILSFEKATDLADRDKVAALETELQAMGVAWTHLRYHKRPAAAATAFDILRGAFAASSLARRLRADVLHSRSYVPALMAHLAGLRVRASSLFDMRGFWVDERVEGGLWARDGWLFRAGKWWERRLLRGSDGIVVLASAAVPRLESLAGCPLDVPIRMIPTCVDLEAFRPRDRRAARTSLGLPEEAFILLHVGSLETWYLGPETFALAETIESQVGSFVMVVLTRDGGRARELLPARLSDRTQILSVEHNEVPQWMAAADAGVALIRPTFSKTASCPTKLGEYLACGLPVATTRGIGDVDGILGDDTGVFLADCSSESLDLAGLRLIELASRVETAMRCRVVAERFFSLEDGVDRFLSLYRELRLRE